MNAIISNKFISLPMCYVGGYAYDAIYKKISECAPKSLGLIEAERRNFKNYITDGRKGAIFFRASIDGIQKEISYRFILETMILPAIFPQFRAYSIARTCTSSLVFAAFFWYNSKENNLERASMAFLIGVVSSLAQKQFGILGSMFFVSGMILHSYQYRYSESLQTLGKSIRAIKRSDVISRERIGHYLKGFIDDATSPFRLIRSIFRYATSKAC